VSSLEVEVKAAEAKNEALLQERPKTAPRSRSPEVNSYFIIIVPFQDTLLVAYLFDRAEGKFFWGVRSQIFLQQC